MERWNSLTKEQQERFIPLCPDFIVELRSSRDTLAGLRAKLGEYMDNGTQLGWLIDPQRQVVEIYRSREEIIVLESPKTASGEEVLPDFVLDLTEIF